MSERMRRISCRGMVSTVKKASAKCSIALKFDQRLATVSGTPAGGNITMKSLRITLLAAFASALALCAGHASAQAYPARPIKLVIAFPPGGTSDYVGRVIAAKLGDYLGQPIV